MKINPTVTRVRNIGRKGLHRLQDYANLHEEGKVPFSDGDKINWENVELYALSHDGSFQLVKEKGPPKKTLLCKGVDCVSSQLWKEISKEV